MQRNRKAVFADLQMSPESGLCSFVIPGKVVSGKNHRGVAAHGKKRMFGFKSKALRHNRKSIVMMMAEQWPLDVPLRARVVVTVELAYSGVEPDALGPVDNLLDSLQEAGILVDDVQVTKVTVTKRRADAVVPEGASMLVVWPAAASGNVPTKSTHAEAFSEAVKRLAKARSDVG